MTIFTDRGIASPAEYFTGTEVLNHDTMDVKTRVLLIMASTIGSEALTEYNMHVHAALNVGITPVEIK